MGCLLGGEKRMRVGIYLAHNAPTAGGSFTFGNNIVDALKKTKNSHEFYCFYYGEAIDGEDKINFISLSKTGNRIANGFFSRLLEKLVSYLKSCLCIGHSVSPLQKSLLQYDIELMWFVYGYEDIKVPFVFTVLDLEHRKHPFFPEVSVTGNTWEKRENHYRSIIPKAAYVIVGTKTGRDEIIRFYQAERERVRVLHFPTPTFVLDYKEKKLDVCKKFDLKTPYLFYPAQFWPHKNHIALLRALVVLKEKFNLDFSLALTGSNKGNLNFIKEKVDEFGLNGSVKFLGFVSQEDLLGLYNNAFAMVFPSFFGPDNIPPLEAFALGCPVIASSISGAEDQLHNAALLVDPKDEQAIAEAIKELMDNDGRRDTLIEQGRVLARRWTSDDYVLEMIKIIDEFEPYRRCWSSKNVYQHT